jgi:hypothetical protein
MAGSISCLIPNIFRICASYAYRVQTFKAMIHKSAIFILALFFVALLLANYGSCIYIVIIRALIFLFCLALAILGLLVIRKPFLFIWLNKIGGRLLEAIDKDILQDNT